MLQKKVAQETLQYGSEKIVKRMTESAKPDISSLSADEILARDW